MDKEDIELEMDVELKEQFEKVLESLGLDINTAFNIFAHEVIKQGKLPFELVPNQETVEAMQDGKVTHYKNSKEMFDALGI